MDRGSSLRVGLLPLPFEPEGLSRQSSVRRYSDEHSTSELEDLLERVPDLPPRPLTDLPRRRRVGPDPLGLRLEVLLARRRRLGARLEPLALRLRAPLVREVARLDVHLALHHPRRRVPRPRRRGL